MNSYSARMHLCEREVVGILGIMGMKFLRFFSPLLKAVANQHGKAADVQCDC